MDRITQTVILVDNSTAPTGASKALISIAAGLRDRYKFVVISPNPSIYEDLSPGIELHQLSFKELSKKISSLLYPYYLIRHGRKVAAIIRNYPEPVLHYNDCYNLTGAVVKLFSPSVYLIYHIRLLPDSYLRPLYPFLIRVIFLFADKVICNSTATCRNLPDNGKKNFIPDGMAIPSKLPPFRGNADKIRLLYVGNYIPGKGQDFALDCFRELRKLRSDTTLRFVGGTMGLQRNEQYKKDIMGMASEMGLTGYIEFAGYVDDISSEYSSADVLLNFSKSESFSLVCLEGMAYGTTVVSLNSGGPADFVRHRETGILLDRDASPSDVAIALNELLSKPDLRERMRINAYNLVSSEYNISTQLKKLDQLYEGK